MNNKTEEMSELVETLRAAAEAATPGKRTVRIGGGRGDFYVYSPDEQKAEAAASDDGVDGYTVSKPNQVYLQLVSDPAVILKLLSSLPPSGPTPELANDQGFVTRIEEFDGSFVAYGVMGLVASDPTREGAIEKLRKLTIRQVDGPNHKSGLLPPSGAASEPCPRCKVGSNSRGRGGSDKCFHCDSCDFVNCIDNFPEFEK